MEWKDQYKHPEWQRKRLERLQESQFRCDLCCDTEKQLHVHHKQYFKGRKMWEYSVSELTTLCADCHQEAHKTNDRLKEALALLDASHMEFVIGYCTALYLLSRDDECSVHIPNVEFAMGISDAYRINEDDVVRSIMEGNGYQISNAKLWSLRKKED